MAGPTTLVTPPPPTGVCDTATVSRVVGRGAACAPGGDQLSHVALMRTQRTGRSNGTACARLLPSNVPSFALAYHPHIRSTQHNVCILSRHVVYWADRDTALAGDRLELN